MSVPVLNAENLRKSYRHADGVVRALDGVSVSVDAGQFIVVRGPSGSGKTTLLLAAGGLLAPDAGRVALIGQDPYGLSPDARARLRAANVGFVFQQFHLVPYLSAIDNVRAAALGGPDPGAADRAEELIDRFSLTDRAGHLPGQLSVGERQRTGLARAMLNNPKLICADEPTGNLDEA
ncbi:MAG: ABC transporter ATP-binding protein, partial [Planctomycetota bacterium]